MERELEFETSITDIEKTLEKLKHLAEHKKGNFRDQIIDLEARLVAAEQQVYDNLTPWQTVPIARHAKRPVLQEYIGYIFSDFVELHGDRAFGDDAALIGGFAMLGKEKVMIMGHNKGKNIEENIKRNFGMARPEGYRKALRLMRLAERFNIPVITFIDTPGAFPGLDAEERGQHEAIARNLTEMARLATPIVAVVTGEGGSGGALGIGVADKILMLKYAVYSVISPEGCAGILWRDNSFAPQAAEAMKITAKSLLELGVIDGIVAEPPGGAHRYPEKTADAIKKELITALDSFKNVTTAHLIDARFKKFSAMGKFNE